MIEINPEKIFNLDSFVNTISENDNVRNQVPEDVYHSVVEIYEIICGSLTGPYEGMGDEVLFDYFERDSIEWFCDSMEFFPLEDDDGSTPLNNLIIQSLMMDNIMGCISQVKQTKKGITFI